MKKKLETNSVAGILSRLGKDQSGNTIAIMAAAVIPVLGLVGGSVDMSRIYLTQTRLQAACDAGALMGRKTMGSGQWADYSGRANTEALKVFAANFKDGSYGTENLSRAFTETSGRVEGNATVDIPMTLMRVLGQDERTIRVSCSAEMRIPNSDVMFVLDTTGSMNGTVAGGSATATNPVRIAGLRIATKCFYETLTQKNIDDVTPAQCSETADPVETASNTSQIRFGFVPYSINVNVGRLLPLDHIADSWFYQTRRANFVNDPDNSYSLGNLSTLTQVGSPTTNPSPGSWQNAQNNVNINGTTYLKTVQVNRAPLNCNNITWPPTQTSGPTTNGPYQTGTTPTPVYPATSVTETYQKTVTSGSMQYRYIPENSNVSSNKKCFLQYKSSSSVETTNYTGTRPVTWIPATVFNNWTYDRFSVNVSGLKNTGNNSWNSSLVLPTGNNGSNATINWDGCILERPTQRNVTTWDTSDTSPQKDMAIDLIPSAADPTTQWGPRLPDIVYERNDGSGNRTTNAVTTTNNFNTAPDDGSDDTCPSPSRLLQVWDPTPFRNYVNGLQTGGNTFHDIGLLWGARLASPTGLFAANNAVPNDNVQRHLIFMTDGETNANSASMSAYGFPWYDRLQTDTASAPTTSQLNALTDERFNALCDAVKNKNITLWVVSYGAGIDVATTNRLRSCATDPDKFFQYTPGVSLTQQFKQIASRIAALRLTT